LRELYANSDSVGIRAMAMVNVHKDMTIEQFKEAAQDL
jgi:hypothetical protein